MKSRILLVVVVAALMLVAVGAFVQAGHITPVEACASHGLGPNFRYAEGPDSALMRCVNSIDTSH